MTSNAYAISKLDHLSGMAPDSNVSISEQSSQEGEKGYTSEEILEEYCGEQENTRIILWSRQNNDNATQYTCFFVADARFS
jgi:hypothetical protein